jgi:hypothetical protein
VALYLEPLEPREVPATYTVDTLSNMPNLGNPATLTGSLPWCVIMANRDVNAPRIINFDAMLNGTIDMGGGIAVQRDMTINSNGNVTVDRLSTATGGFSIFSISQSITCTIDSLKISGGQAGSGGGIYNSGTLALYSCTLVGEL